MSDFPTIDPSLLRVDRTDEGASAALPDDYFIRQRREQPVNVPLPQTLAWIRDLPQDVQPQALLRQFPRIANAIAATWSEAVSCKAVMNKLLIDTRGNRQGFPKEIRRELLALWAFREPAVRSPDPHEQVGKRG
jgi:hypothetical protein